MIYEEFFNNFIFGMNYKSAVDACETNGFTTRIVSENGVDFIVTCDFNPKRVNFVIENGIVVKCDIG
jgi:hypothetical protein